MNNTRKYDNKLLNSNVINNCQININNIHYNNYNPKGGDIKEKIMNLFKKKNYIFIATSKMNKLFSKSQPEILEKKKKKYKHFSTNSSPINKNINIYKTKVKALKEISIHNSNKNTKSSHGAGKKHVNQEPKNTDGNVLSNKNTIKLNPIKGQSNDIEDNKTDLNISFKKINNEKEILELKNNLLNKSPKELVNEKEGEKNDLVNSSNTSSIVADANYYMEKSKTLSKYITEYYNKYKKYPPTNLDFYLYGRLIGQGAFGKVNIGLNVLTGRVVAIKSFNKKVLIKNGDNMRNSMYETNLMKKLNHPNITKILEMFEDEDYILLTMEYINGGNLFS
jgi:hypothetical protein